MKKKLKKSPKRKTLKKSKQLDIIAKDKPKRPMGRPPIWENPEDLQASLDLYFDYCDTFTVMEDVMQGGTAVGRREVNRPKPYTVSGLALWLGVDRLTLIRYADKKEFCNTILNAKTRIEQQLEERLVTGINNTGVAFNLKNNFKWKDKTEIDQNIKGGLNLIGILDKAKAAKESQS